MLILLLHKWVFYDGGMTSQKYKSSRSVVIDQMDVKSRSIVSMHEVFGHGVALMYGLSHYENNVNSIRAENLGRRFLGLSPVGGGNHVINTNDINLADPPYIIK